MKHKSKSIVSLKTNKVLPTKRASTAIPEVDSIERRLKNLTKYDRLELEDIAKAKVFRKSLREEYNELNDKFNSQDVINKPNLINRVLATIVDYSLILIIFYLSFRFLNLSSLVMSSKPKTDLLHLVLRFLFSTTVACFIPALIFKATIGKLIFGIRIRGLKYFIPNVFQVFLREVITKPFTIVSVFGIQSFFKNPNKVQLFEKISSTQVIKKE